MDVLTGSLLTLGTMALVGISARWNWWRLPGPGIPVLMYHKIGVTPKGSKQKKLWVSEEQFYKHMSYLKKNDYTPITFEEVLKAGKRENSAPFKPVIITFDDGYANVYSSAFPVMRRFGFRAVVFIVVQAIGWDNFWHDSSIEPHIPMLSWKQVEEMQSAGIEFGSHTMCHVNLLQVERKRVQEEICKSFRVLEEFLGRKPLVFAYPYGEGVDDIGIRQTVKDAGYSFACGIHQGKANLDGDLYSFRRILVRGDDSMLDFYLNVTRGRARL